VLKGGTPCGRNFHIQNFRLRGEGMTWNPSDPAATATIAGGSEVPDTVAKIFADTAWNHVFGVWAKDEAQSGGQSLPWVLYQFYTDANKDPLGLELDRKYFSDSATEPLLRTSQTDSLWVMWRRQGQGIGASMQDFADRAAEILDWDEEVWFGFKQDVDHVAKTAASDPEAVAEAVRQAETAKIQAATPSAPQNAPLTRARIDQAVVDNVNQVELKDLAEQSLIGFSMSDDLLLIGDKHPQAYLKFVTDNGGHQGMLKMEARGSAFKTGEVWVEEADWFDEKKLLAAIQRFSKKKLMVVDDINNANPTRREVK
jgi:hypothetical protein